MDPSTNHSCLRRRAGQALLPFPCSPVLNSSIEQSHHHCNEPDADGTLATRLNTACTPTPGHEHAWAIEPPLPCLLSSPSCPSPCAVPCSPSSSEEPSQRFTKVPVVSEYIEANGQVSSQRDSEANWLQVGGQRAKTNLELETRELLRTFRLRGEQWNGPIQDLGLTAAGESHARPSNAEYPPRRTSGSNRSPAVATDATDSWSQKTEVREGGDTFVIIDIHDNTIVPDLILPASPASSSRTAASSVSTVRTKVFAAYHPILNSEPWETVANEATVSMTRLQAASQACGAGTSTQEGIQSLAPDVTEQTRRSEVRSLSNTDETTSHRRRCCSVGFWRASSGPRPRGDEPPAAVDVCSTEGRQQQHSDATHCQSNSSVPQANRLEQGYEGLGSEQHQSIIAQERVPTVESDATVSPGAAEDTRAVLLEVREAQTALHDSHTLDADSRTGWNAIQSVIAIFLCRAEVPPIEPRSHGQDELRSNPTATVSAIGSDCPTWSTSIIAASAESSEDSSSILTSSSSRIIFGRILLGLEELITMLSQLVKPDSRSRDTQVV